MNRNETQLNDFSWVDINNPDAEMLAQVASELKLPQKVLSNCLDPDYLPHLEVYGDCLFIILRLMEPETKLTADSVQDLTTKVALFVSPKKIVSIHRLPLREITEIEVKIKSKKHGEVTKDYLIALFFEQVSAGFNKPLTDLEHKLEKFEEKLFQSQGVKSLLLEGYYIKRKASAFRKVMKLTIDVLVKMIVRSSLQTTRMQEIKDALDRNLFYAEDANENIQSLLNLHLSIESQKTNEASYRTNEIMRVLTVLSIFFLPLNFLAGVFGMNFEFTPLIKDSNGFWLTVGSMILICLLLSMYILKKGWLMNRVSYGKDVNSDTKSDS